MKSLKEAIKLDVEEGDVILTGRFKNKRKIVKSIGTDKYGQPTINGKSILKFKIEKKMPKKMWSAKSREELKESDLRKVIRDIILENCKRERYWGVAGAGVIVLCTEELSIYLQKRSTRVGSGDGSWAFPGGGLQSEKSRGFIKTPIPKHLQVSPGDSVLEELAFGELEEEAGANGLPQWTLLEEIVSYEDCGFIYKTFIIDISAEEKARWTPKPSMNCAWEVADHGWHDGEYFDEDLNLHHGISATLLQAIKKYIG